MNTIWQQLLDYTKDIKSNLIKHPLLDTLNEYIVIQNHEPDIEEWLEHNKTYGFTESLGLLSKFTDEFIYFVYNPSLNQVSILEDDVIPTENHVLLNHVRLSEEENLAEFIYTILIDAHDEFSFEMMLLLNHHSLTDKEVLDVLIKESPVETQLRFLTKSTELGTMYCYIANVTHRGIDSKICIEINFDTNEELTNISRTVSMYGRMVEYELIYEKEFEYHEMIPDIFLINQLLSLS